MSSAFMTSCLNNDTEISYSPDATIKGFELDSVHHVSYQFTIDQLKGEIYNIDSMPAHADTIIDRILIKKITTASSVITVKSSDGQRDSIININDSIDFRGTMEKPMKITVWAPNMQNKKDYRISVRVHQQDPDSLNWGTTPMAVAPISGVQKTIILNDKILVFSSDNQKIYSSMISDGHTWTAQSLTGMPTNFKLSSIIAFGEKLYTVTETGEVYQSDAAGLAWSKHEGLSQHKVNSLIAIFPTLEGASSSTELGIAGIIDEEGTFKFNKTNSTATLWSESMGENVPEDFPINYYSSTPFLTKTKTLNIALVGNTRSGLENDTTTIVWTSENGKSWYPMRISGNKTCPKFENPSIMHYNDKFYIFGKGFEAFYESTTLLYWNKVTEKFLFPKWTLTSESAKPDYSMVVDRNHFIWLMTGQPLNEVWKGRVNKLGFIRQ